MTESPGVTRRDEYNLKLLANVHPPDWINPEPEDRYNLVVLGAGTAGQVSAAGAAGMGAKDTIVGATIVARHAGEMISELTIAMVGTIGLGRLASVIHPYPTEAEAIRKAADLYNRTRLTEWGSRLLRGYFSWRRR
jgi:hypothetical protein